MNHEKIIESLEEVPFEPAHLLNPRRETEKLIDKQAIIAVLQDALNELGKVHHELLPASERISTIRPSTFIPYDASRKQFDSDASQFTEEEPIIGNALLALQLSIQRMRAPRCSYSDVADAFNAALYFLDLDSNNAEVANLLRENPVFSVFPQYREAQRGTEAIVLERIQKAALDLIKRCLCLLQADHIRRYINTSKGFELQKIIQCTLNELHKLCHPWLKNYSEDERQKILENSEESDSQSHDDSRWFGLEGSRDSDLGVQANTDSESEILNVLQAHKNHLIALDKIFSVEPK